MIHPLKHGTILLFTAAALLFAGCTEEGIVSPELAPGERADADAALALGRTDGAVTVPFKARFYTDLAGLAPDPACGDSEENIFLNTQEGAGQATHLGNFEIRITFCVDATDILDDGKLAEGESLPYWDGVGTFTAASGDELWFTISGAVLPSDHPDFDFEFADPFEFTEDKSTGRFQGASGHGVTNSFVDFQSEPSRTEHDWSGMLTLLPGK